MRTLVAISSSNCHQNGHMCVCVFVRFFVFVCGSSYRYLKHFLCQSQNCRNGQLDIEMRTNTHRQNRHTHTHTHTNTNKQATNTHKTNKQTHTQVNTHTQTSTQSSNFLDLCIDPNLPIILGIPARAEATHVQGLTKYFCQCVSLTF